MGNIARKKSRKISSSTEIDPKEFIIPNLASIVNCSKIQWSTYMFIALHPFLLRP